jgi:hypothetical protein
LIVVGLSESPVGNPEFAHVVFMWALTGFGENVEVAVRVPE